MEGSRSFYAYFKWDFTRGFYVSRVGWCRNVFWVRVKVYTCIDRRNMNFVISYRVLRRVCLQFHDTSNDPCMNTRNTSLTLAPNTDITHAVHSRNIHVLPIPDEYWFPGHEDQSCLGTNVLVWYMYVCYRVQLQRWGISLVKPPILLFIT